MISAYFDVKPRKAASVAVRVPSSACDVFKPAPGFAPRAAVTGSPQAVTAGLTMHAEFRPLPEGGSPVAGSYASDGWLDGQDGQDGQDGLDDDGQDGMDGMDTMSDYLDEESLTGITSVAEDAEEVVPEDELEADACVDAHFFARRKQCSVDRPSVVFSGPMLCCDEEDFD